MINHMDDLIRRNVPTLRTSSHQAPPAEPVDELTQLIRQQRVEAVEQLRMDQLKRQQRAAEAAAEAESLRAENELEDERLRQEELRAERRARRLGGAGGGGPDASVLPALMDMMVQSQRDTQARLDAINAQQQEALKGELGALKELIHRVMDRPQPDAIETVRQQIEFFQTLQGLVPKPSAEPKTSSLREMLEVKRFEAEMDMERAKFQRDLQRDDQERAKWEAEAQAAQHRATMLGGMISQAFPQLTEAVTARIAGRPEQPVAPGPQLPPPPVPANGNGHVPGLPQALPWTCPKCTTTNYAALGSSTAACTSCEQMVELEPAAPAVAPPDAPDPEE